MKRSYLSSAVSTTALVLAAGSVAADTILIPIAHSGQDAPGVPGAVFARLAQPRLLDDGTVCFWARLEGQGITDANDGSIWSDRSGAMAIAYREGDSAPFDADIRWGAFPFPALNAAGDLSFTAALIDADNPDAPTNLGIFAEDDRVTLIVAREGFSAPGLPDGGVFEGLPIAPFTDTGSVVFSATNGAGAWSWMGSDPVPLVITGDAAPLVGPPWEFSFIDSPVDGGDGAAAFRASLIDPADPKDSRPSLWFIAGGALQFIAWADPVQQGRYFTDFGISPVIAAQGRVRFWASAAGDGVDAANDTAIYQFAGGNLEMLIEEGAAAPGGGQFGQLPSQFAGNPAGDLALVAPLVGPDINSENNSGIYLRSGGGQLVRIAREGDQAPGLPDGITFAILGRPAINSSGDLAFTAHLRGAEQGNNFALFITRGQEVLPLIRTGDSVDTGGGIFRTIRDVGFASGDDGSGFSQFAPDGTLVLHLTFDDKTHGLFAATSGPGCYADLDESGSLDLFDFLAFVNLFNAADPAADCDGSGGLDLFDFLCFGNAFNAGC